MHLRSMSNGVNTYAKANLHSGSDMPRWNTDNLITHIAAAALIVDDLEVDVNDLRDDLKVDNKECVLTQTDFMRLLI